MKFAFSSSDNAMFSCSTQKLLKSCTPPSSTRGSDTVWVRLANIPVFTASSLVAAGEDVLAVGGCSDNYGKQPSSDIYSYNRANNSWTPFGQLPIPLHKVLTASLPTNEIVMAGGFRKGFSS